MERDTKLAIATLMVMAFTIGTDFTGALLLVTAIERELAADITTTQWVLNIYALTFGVMMVTGGPPGRHVRAPASDYDRRGDLLGCVHRLFFGA